jgi:hypothetical protein
MAKEWLPVMTANAAAWGIPPAVLTEFGVLIQTADTALITAKNKTTRTPVATAQCREAFEALTAKMRDIKKRYFLTPPLTEADYIALGLKLHDSTPTASGTPTAQVTVETYLVGRHESMGGCKRSPSGRKDRMGKANREGAIKNKPKSTKKRKKRAGRNSNGTTRLLYKGGCRTGTKNGGTGRRGTARGG